MTNRLLVIPAIAVLAVAPTLALQQHGFASTRSEAASSLFRNQVGVAKLPYTSRCNVVWMQSTNDDHSTSSQKASILHRLRRGYNFKKVSSASRHPIFQLLQQSLLKYTFILRNANQAMTLTVSNSLFGSAARGSHVKVWWQSTMKKVAALLLALVVIFSPHPPAAHASADYFAPPAHFQQTRVVPNPYYEVVSQDDEMPGAQLEGDLYASSQNLVTRKKTPASFSSGLEVSNMAMERVAQKEPSTQETTTAAVQAEEPNSLKREDEVLAFGFVAASAVGAILGTRFSAGKTGGYGQYYPTKDKTKESRSDTRVGGFSQYKPKDSPPPGVEYFVYNGRGLLDGFGSGVGGFGKDFKEKESAYFRQKSRDEGVSQKWAGTFSQHKPNPDLVYYENKAIEASYKLPTYEDGIDTDFEGVGTFGLYRPDPSKIVVNEVTKDLIQDVVLDDDDDEDVIVGGFSSVGGFGRSRPEARKYFEDKPSTTGSAGSFSQYKTEASEKVKRNSGLEALNELTGYKIGYDHEDDVDTEGDTKSRGVGGFSQYRPLEPPSFVYDSSKRTSKGKLSFFGGAGSYSQYKPKAIEEVNTPPPAASIGESDGISGSAFLISPEAILEDVEAIESMEAERKTKESNEKPADN